MPTALPAEAFLAIAAVARADGIVRKGEAAGLKRAAESYGISGEDLEAVERATTDGASLEDIDLSSMNDWQRALTYSFANWLAQVDGVVNSAELAHLRTLAAKLELAHSKLEHAKSAAYDIACLPEGQRPDKYDFGKLEERLAQKLPATKRSSQAPDGDG